MPRHNKKRTKPKSKARKQTQTPISVNPVYGTQDSMGTSTAVGAGAMPAATADSGMNNNVMPTSTIFDWNICSWLPNPTNVRVVV